MSQKLNFAFLGTPEVASKTLESLKAGGFLPSVVVTGTDKPVGRGMKLTPTPVKSWALENNIPVVHSLKELAGDFDLFVVVAYGEILKQEELDRPRLGAINVHYSLLPKWRGASPVESAVLTGDKVTGVTIQQMKYEMDAGDIISQKETGIGNEETTPMLRERLITLGGELLVDTLRNIEKITKTPQNESEATFCKKIKKEDGLLDLNEDGIKNYNKYRAYAYWPRTYFFKDGKRIIITKAHLEGDKFIIDKVIPEGGKEINFNTSQ